MARTLRPIEVIERFGRCLELIPIDNHFHKVSVSLYLKDNIYTVWSFSDKAGIENRLLEVRNQIVTVGGLSPIAETSNQAKFDCEDVHHRPIKFVAAQAVNKPPDYTPPHGSLSIKDSKTELTIQVAGAEENNAWIYSVSVNGDAKKPAIRLRMIIAGFIRYGEMEKLSDTKIMFACRQRHDELIRILLPYSRNISSVESMISAEALRGQMTTGTLGFTPL